MALSKAFQRIFWKNFPSTDTAIDEENLNKMDYALDEIDNRVVQLSGYETRVQEYANQASTNASNSLTYSRNSKVSADDSKNYAELSRQYMNRAFDTTPEGYAEVVANSTISNANGESLSLQTGKGGIRVNKIVGKSYKSKNLWDEEWETGYYTDGTNIKMDADTVRCKNPIAAKPNTSYYFALNYVVNLRVNFLDANLNGIGTTNYIRNNTSFVTPNNCSFINFNLMDAYGTVYKNDIAIIEGTSGEYEPYGIFSSGDSGNIEIVEHGGVDTGVYGVEVDMVNKTFTRLADSVGKSAGTDFDSVQAFNRRRCNVLDNGSVVAYYGDSNYREDGTNGQVMLEQNRFFYRVEPITIEKISGGKGYHLRKARYYISDVPRDGFKIHPLFVRNGKIVDKVYLSAYEGSTYDVSANSYNKTDAQTVDWENDKLASIANAKPTSGLTQTGATRNGFRIIASNRGSGWTQATVQSATATEILFLVEYASFDMQTNIGQGITQKDSGSGNESENTGLTSALGNKSGVGTNNAVSYRGEENPFGNIWKWIDGINIYNYGEGSVHIADHDFADNKKDGAYQDAGITICGSNGYVSAFAYNEDFDWLFIASECSGNNKLPVGDYFYQNKASNQYTVAWLGGGWDGGSGAGGFCWLVSLASSSRSRGVGGRLLYVPEEQEPKNTKQIYIPLSEPLCSVGDIHDYLDENGEHHYIGSVDLGSLSWTLSSDIFVSEEIPSIKIPSSNNEIANIICNKYLVIPAILIEDKKIALSQNKKIWIKDSAYTNAESFKTAMQGVMLYYELATPTTEPLTTEQLKALYSLESFKSHTYIDTSDVYAKATLDVDYGMGDVSATAINGERIAKQNQAIIDSNVASLQALILDIE